MQTAHARLMARYRAGDVPWDSPTPPPELVATVSPLPAGRALDAGCGFGRNSIWLAARGWQVDAVDFVQPALEEARRRATAAAARSVTFHEADVSALRFLPSGAFDLVVDIGCSHALAPEQWEQYGAGLARLLRPGGLWLLYGRLRESADFSPDGPSGIDETAQRLLLSPSFALERCEHGTNQGGSPWPSVWQWWRRVGSRE
jgi:SAM-dependent methyltransferase